MNSHCESKHRRTRVLRAAMLVIALAIGCALPTAAPAQSTDIEDWRGFAAGSWVALRTTSETLDEQGQVVSQSTSTIEYRVERASAEEIVLDVAEGVVEYGGKQFPTPAAKLVLRPFGQADDEKVTEVDDPDDEDADDEDADATKPAAESKPTAESKRPRRRTVKAILASDTGKREVTAEFRGASADSPVRRVVKTFDTTGEPIATSTTDVWVENVRFPLRGRRSITYYRTHYRNHKLSSTSVVAKSNDVPGQLVSAITVERDASGRVVRRNEQVVVAYEVAKESTIGMAFEQYRSRRDLRREERRSRR